MLTFVVSLTNFEDLKMCVHDILSSPKSPKCCPSRLKVCVCGGGAICIIWQTIRCVEQSFVSSSYFFCILTLPFYVESVDRGIEWTFVHFARNTNIFSSIENFLTSTRCYFSPNTSFPTFHWKKHLTTLGRGQTTYSLIFKLETAFWPFWICKSRM